MFISIAVCEQDQEHIKLLRRLLTEMSIQYNFEVQLYWIFGDNIEGKLLEQEEYINLALISLDMINAGDLGQKLYKTNQSCYILYYKNQGADLEPLLGSRPIAFQQGLQNTELFKEKLIRIWRDIWSQDNKFYYQSKNLVCLLPYSGIAYFESNYKYVIIHTISGRVLQLYQKLDDVERNLTGGLFLRIHKSYIVNMEYAENINKTNHSLWLKNGENVYISKAYYDRTLNIFEKYANGI
jgi:hypothetical protein